VQRSIISEHTEIEEVIVTPLINSFAVTPLPAPNIHFWNFENGLLGLAAFGPNVEPGATFTGSVRRSSMLGNLIFVQNDLAESGGQTHNLPAGFIYRPPIVPHNIVLKQGLTFPMLDTDATNPNPPLPAYNIEFSYPVNTPDHQHIEATDSPKSGLAPSANLLEQVDHVIQFRLYLVWRFDDNSLYFLSYVNWSVSFQADTYVVNKGVTRVTNPNGVTSAPFVRSHLAPEPKALWNPVANDSLEYRPIM
jgi:hypothetical protein